MNIQKKSFIKIMLPIILGTMLTSVVVAKPAWGGREVNIVDKFEHILEYVDLTDDQQEKADLILNELKQNTVNSKSHKGTRLLMMLNPEDPDYLIKVNNHADELSVNMKAKIMQMATAKQALYEILDEEQKIKLSKKLERRMNKLEKRKTH